MKRRIFIFLFFIPIAFLIFGIANILVITNFTQGYGFLKASLISFILVFFIYYIAHTTERRIKNLKKNKQVLSLKIDRVEEIDNVIDIVVSIKKDGYKYTFLSSYFTENDKLDELIKSKINKKATNMKVWVDLNSFKYFEYDISSFLADLNIKDEVELLGWGSTNNPQGL